MCNGRSNGLCNNRNYSIKKKKFIIKEKNIWNNVLEWWSEDRGLFTGRGIGLEHGKSIHRNRKVEYIGRYTGR